MRNLELFLAKALRATNLSTARREIERWAERGESDQLVALLAALETSPPFPGEADRSRQSLADHLERTVALTPGAAQAAATVALAQIPRRVSAQPPRDQPHRQRQLAALLAAAQQPEFLVPLFDDPAARTHAPELLAALLHELVLRGFQAEAVPALQRWHTELRQRGHALAWLPPRLLPAEAAFRQYLPHYHRNGESASLAGWPGPGVAATGAARPRLQLAETTTPEDAERSARAVRSWCDESNGRFEARVFAFEAPLDSAAITADTLLALPLECLAGADGPLVQTLPLTSGQALTLLFAAAATGGAYDHGLGGACARLAAWQSAGALAGCAGDAPFDDGVVAVERCRWWAFGGPGPWFANVAWDLGLLALRPDGRTLAVLAATDTD